MADAKMRNRIVASLFDYKPRDWYPPSEHYPKVPNRREASDNSLAKLLAVADYTKKLELYDDTRQSIAIGRKEIEEVINFRKSGKPAIIATHIENLNSFNFQLRDRATRELPPFGEWALPQLREALAHAPSAKARRRIENVIRDINVSMGKNEMPD